MAAPTYDHRTVQNNTAKCENGTTVVWYDGLPIVHKMRYLFADLAWTLTVICVSHQRVSSDELFWHKLQQIMPT